MNACAVRDHFYHYIDRLANFTCIIASIRLHFHITVPTCAGLLIFLGDGA